MTSNIINNKDEQVQQLLRPLLFLLKKTEITEITINRPGEVWTKSTKGWDYHKIPELSNAYLRSLATSIIVFNGLEAKPITSALMPGGERCQIVMPPACIDGTLSMSIRKHTEMSISLEELNEMEAFKNCLDVSFNKPKKEEILSFLDRNDFTRLIEFEIELLELKRSALWLEFLSHAVLYKRNIVIAGKTGSGKTTLARSLIAKVPTTERLITIEDVHELCLENHPNKVHMLYGYGKGRISADECLASCMRQSPDRIFLAELRGSEAWEYLNSLNTGHPGSVTTVHANSCLATFERVATLVKKSEIGQLLDMELIKSVLHKTIDIILYYQEFKLVEIFYDPIFAKSKF